MWPVESARGKIPEEPDAVLMDRMRRQLSTDGGPQFVGIDGRSGAGKSTLAGVVASGLDASGRAVLVIDGDDFYAGGSARTWDRRTAAQQVERVIDWRRQRQVLESLREHGKATWYPFDWDATDWDAEPPPFSTVPIHTRVGEVVILEGAYSCRPELSGLLDLTVLLRTSDEVRTRRLRARDGRDEHADWSARWAGAEDYYFTHVMPPGDFDLVLHSG